MSKMYRLGIRKSRKKQGNGQIAGTTPIDGKNFVWAANYSRPQGDFAVIESVGKDGSLAGKWLFSLNFCDKDEVSFERNNTRSLSTKERKHLLNSLFPTVGDIAYAEAFCSEA